MCNIRPPEPPQTPELCPTCRQPFDDLKGVHGGCPDEKIVYVRTKKVGYLIGHHGRTIWGFESTSGAKIDILFPNSRDDETPVRIAGSVKSVRVALRLVLDLFSLHNYSSQSWDQLRHQSGSQANEGSADIIANETTTISFSVAQSFKDPNNISKIEKEHGSKIIIQPESEDLDGNYVINIIGTAETNSKAVAAVKLQLDSINRKELEPGELFGCEIIEEGRVEKRIRRDSNISTCSSAINEASNNAETESKGSSKDVDCLTLSSFNLACMSLQQLCRKRGVGIEVERFQGDQQVMISGTKVSIKNIREELKEKVFQFEGGFKHKNNNCCKDNCRCSYAIRINPDSVEEAECD